VGDRLERRATDGNRILAVVAGTGVNSDGRKSGLTVPSHAAKAELLRDVYGRAGIAPADIVEPPPGADCRYTMSVAT
jgi:phthiocerol/phenolphthiocerol synthesis type-I polyketide synthase C